MKAHFAVLIAAGILFSFPVAAKSPKQEAVVVASTSEKFELLVEAIRQEMAPGKRYEFLRSHDRATVNSSLDLMSDMLKKAGNVDALSKDEQIRLFNEQEKVNGLLAKNADDRLICTYVAPVGSHLPVKSCRTARQVEQARNNFRNQSQELNNQGRISTGGN